MKLIGFRHSIVIGILPEAKGGKNSISIVYLTVSVASPFWLIEFGKREESISFLTLLRLRLRGHIPEQFGAVIYSPITISVQG
jgi:hypothetical protein